MLTSIDTYLNVRRAAGYKLDSAQRYLASYARFAPNETHVRTDTVLHWARQARSEASRAARLQALVRFARYFFQGQDQKSIKE